jgi:hypothetical protein
VVWTAQTTKLDTIRLASYSLRADPQSDVGGHSTPTTDEIYILAFAFASVGRISLKE